jgi:hypothetical protein
MIRVRLTCSAGLLLGLLLLATLPLAASPPSTSAECTCAMILELDGWCAVHSIGYIAGLEIETYLLFEVLDAHGHEVGLTSFQCAACQRAFESQGFCDEHRMGFVSGLAYYSRLTFLVARARASAGSAAPCPECREAAAADGWCGACGGVGFVGSVAFRDRRAYDEVVRALDLVHRADAVGRRCVHCAVAMATDGVCPVCKLEYKDGKPRPFVAREPSGGARRGPPPEAVKDDN